MDHFENTDWKWPVKYVLILILNLLNWDDLTIRRQKLKAILMFKTINGLTPAYLQNSFSTRSTQYNLTSPVHLISSSQTQG